MTTVVSYRQRLAVFEPPPPKPPGILERVSKVAWALLAAMVLAGGIATGIYFLALPLLAFGITIAVGALLGSIGIGVFSYDLSKKIEIKKVAPDTVVSLISDLFKNRELILDTMAKKYAQEINKRLSYYRVDLKIEFKCYGGGFEVCVDGNEDDAYVESILNAVLPFFGERLMALSLEGPNIKGSCLATLNKYDNLRITSFAFKNCDDLRQDDIENFERSYPLAASYVFKSCQYITSRSCDVLKRENIVICSNAGVDNKKEKLDAFNTAFQALLDQHLFSKENREDVRNALKTLADGHNAALLTCQEWNLEGVPMITPAAGEAFAEFIIQWCPNCTNLKLGGGSSRERSGVNNQMIRKLVEKPTFALEKLDLNHCKALQDAKAGDADGTLWWLFGHPSIRALNITGCSNISDEAIDEYIRTVRMSLGYGETFELIGKRGNKQIFSKL